MLQLNAVQKSVEQQNKLWKKKLKEMTNNYDHQLKEVLSLTIQHNILYISHSLKDVLKF